MYNIKIGGMSTSTGREGIDGIDGIESIENREKRSIDLLRKLFNSTRCTYTLNMEHKVDETKSEKGKQVKVGENGTRGNRDEIVDISPDNPENENTVITVNMLSDSDASFPCKLDEMICIFPNMRFLSVGSTFHGMEQKATLSGEKTEHTGLLMQQSNGQKRLWSMPPHKHSITETGKFTLKSETTKTHKQDKIEGSVDETLLFSSEVSRVFMQEMLSRVEWLQTERSGCLRSLRLTGNRLKTGSLDTSTVSVLSLNDNGEAIESVDGVIPIQVDFLTLSFNEARDIARNIHKTLPKKRQDMYEFPTNENANFSSDNFADAKDWSDTIVRKQLEQRLQKWNMFALDHTETPWLRNTEQRRTRPTRIAANEGDVLAVNDQAAIMKRNQKDRQKRIEEMAESGNRTGTEKKLKTMLKHRFFHACKPSKNAKWTPNLDWMLLTTTIVYQNQRLEWNEENAKKKMTSIESLITSRQVSKAISSLYALLSAVPVYNSSNSAVFSVGTIAFKRLLYMLSIPEARNELYAASKKGFGKETKQRPTELLVRLYQFKLVLEQKNWNTYPEYSSVSKILKSLQTLNEQKNQTYFTDLEYWLNDTTSTNTIWNGVTMEVDKDSKMAHSEGRVDIYVRTSPYGRDPRSLEPTMLAPSRLDFMDALENAIMRMFCDPDVDSMEAFFTPEGR